jgi:hypothetical protein
MFIVISLRFLGIGIGAGLAVLKGQDAMMRLEHEEHERLAAVHAAVSGDLTDAASEPPKPEAESEPPPPTDDHDEGEGQS